MVINKFKIALKNNLYYIVSFNKDQSFKSIKSLQNNFIITHADKVPNNYAIIYKSYCHQSINSILLSEDTIIKNYIINKKMYL